MPTARCHRCKEQVEVTDGEEATTINGKQQLKGLCGKCGCKVSTFLKSKKEEQPDSSKENTIVEKPKPKAKRSKKEPEAEPEAESLPPVPEKPKRSRKKKDAEAETDE